ncbi:MAG: hypothetical protein DRG78_03115 [Epsilonproteobacteria bacterium]|nr:MAG: hypothetical protein DRG78_03115 [Campylobacterota bacterium]
MNLFIVESPFQLLSAIEANNYFKETSILIVKYNMEEKNNTQLSSIINKFSNFGKVIEIKATKTNYDANLKLFFLLVKLKKENIFYNKIFIGEYRSYHMRKFFDILNPDECFVLDDGNIIFSVIKYIINKKDEYYFDGIKGKIKKSIYSMQVFYLGLAKYKIRRDISIFTCFNINSELNTKIIKHNFNHIKSIGSAHSSKDIVYFYGANLEELGINKEVEIKYLMYVVKYYNNIDYKIMYVSHRKETKEKLLYIENRLAIPIIKNIYPAEIQLILDDVVPRHISSFVSSVLITLPILYNFDSVISFSFKIDNIIEKYKEELSVVKEEYKKTIKVVEID